MISLAAVGTVCASLAVGAGLSRAADKTKSKFNKVLSLGDKAPEWVDLPGVDDQTHSLVDYADSKAVLVVFTCNHCPVAKVYEPRLVEFARVYEKDLQVVAISVSRNGADNLEKMKVRASASGFPYPYLYDASQRSGRDYGATATPHFFLLDGERRIAYMGAFDDNIDSKKVERHYLVDAVKSVLAGQAPRVRESLQRGCLIEYE